MGFGVRGSGFGVWGLGLEVWGLGFGVWVWSLGFGIWIYGLGFTDRFSGGSRIFSGHHLLEEYRCPLHLRVYVSYKRGTPVGSHAPTVGGHHVVEENRCPLHLRVQGLALRLIDLCITQL